MILRLPVIKNDKEMRKKLREERRKAKLLDKLKDKNSEEMNEKIAREERKILKAQRMLESIRLIEALFRRIKVSTEFFLDQKNEMNTICFLGFFTQH